MNRFNPHKQKLFEALNNSEGCKQVLRPEVSALLGEVTGCQVAERGPGPFADIAFPA